ncbi:protein of unknown function [Pseudomonas mediterranea]
MRVAAHSAIRFGHLSNVRRIRANLSMATLLSVCFAVGCARGTFECAGCLTSRLTNLRTAHHPRLVTRGMSATSKSGASPWSR